MILTDTGPLVALVNRGDMHHADCVAVVKASPGETLLSTWPCFTEAMYLVRRLGGPATVTALWEIQRAGDLILFDLLADDVARVDDLMHKYSDLPMDIADASLVAIAERLKLRQVFSLDGHFRIYRLADGSALDVVP